MPSTGSERDDLLVSVVRELEGVGREATHWAVASRGRALGYWKAFDVQKQLRGLARAGRLTTVRLPGRGQPIAYRASERPRAALGGSAAAVRGRDDVHGKQTAQPEGTS